MSISLFSWNINAINYYGSTPLNKVIRVLEDLQADILCLQEVANGVYRKEFFRRMNNYPFKVSYQSNSRLEYNNNVILSKYPVVKCGQIKFEQFDSKVYENVTWADIKIKKDLIRVYCCHLKIFGAGIIERLNQLKILLKHQQAIRHAVIICGDMNTTITKAGMSRKIIQLFHKEKDESMFINGKVFNDDERIIFNKIAMDYGFKESIDLSKTMWSTPLFKIPLFNLKLDWCLTKRLVIEHASLGKFVTDHKWISIKFSMNR